MGDQKILTNQRKREVLKIKETPPRVLFVIHLSETTETFHNTELDCKTDLNTPIPIHVALKAQ